ncbi:MAG: bifunctional (p)ppGpp synthetase/guanosine-3',5'-bis(diphosphate) 3'-pyrophosphohydrolase [Deltaproteobacteria bacterium]|nr:bifunctional (p)ppGpp synthetase/guanosine-3',5'-bis(diphosphate) 3'-pyrophosphohydrolase [Deltaproteobacteria bacterium]
MWSPDQYKAALDFAARAHGDQRVPGTGYPYVVHLAKVALEAMTACAADPSLDADLAVCCALLHDCLEDAGVSRAELEARFGRALAAGVAALSKDDSLPKQRRMEDSLERIRQQPREVWLVKLADRVTNLEPPPPQWTLEKRRAYRDEARTILERLRGASEPLALRLEQKIEAYGAFCTN